MILLHYLATFAGLLVIRITANDDVHLFVLHDKHAHARTSTFLPCFMYDVTPSIWRFVSKDGKMINWSTSGTLLLFLLTLIIIMSIVAEKKQDLDIGDDESANIRIHECRITR